MNGSGSSSSKLNTPGCFHSPVMTCLAPIIAGNQTVNFLLEALALDGVPAEMDVELKFLKPVFWDDSVAVQGKRENGAITELRAVNGDGETVATGVVNSVRY